MDLGTLRGLITLALMLAFVGLVFHVYARGRKAQFDAVARLPLEEAPTADDHSEEMRDEFR